MSMTTAQQAELLDTLATFGLGAGAAVAAAGCIGCAFGAWAAWKLAPPNDVSTDHARLARALGEPVAEHAFEDAGNIADLGELDSRRKAYIVRGGCFDLAGLVVLHGQEGFSLEKTIFWNLKGFPAKVIRDRLGITLFWTEKSQELINRAFAKIPAAPQHDRALGEFMTKECNFGMEHADGHFMDHLKFCYEYSAAHFKERSPRVLFLHSILGVGTNFFPMKVEKVPQLKAMLTEFEWEQIEAFPTVLRLVYHGPMMDELQGLAKTNPVRLGQLSKVVVHRVIDNARIELSAEAFWIQLNYQLIHLLDFLPFASWKANADDIFLHNFELLYSLLQQARQLRCNVNFDVTEASGARAGQRTTLRLALLRLVTPKIMWQVGRKQIAKYSAAINHSLKYELHF